MKSLLNEKRPPMFCPGCSHTRSVKALDVALGKLRCAAEEVVIVSDIGCSGLFDIFFSTHAFHGLHGRALTYATGLKLARPELSVVVVMGDGGLGIGGAHLLAACRRNLDITLLVLNNFNYGMTGGQCSATSMVDLQTSSGFLSELEPPLDVCQLAAAAGAPFVERGFAEDGNLHRRLERAISFAGFALVDIWSICPGRLGRKNKISRKELEKKMAAMMVVPQGGLVEANQRQEYGSSYRLRAAEIKSRGSVQVEMELSDGIAQRMEILILGGAGQFVTTLGEILCLGGMAAGAEVSLKNDYPITVLRGHSIAEVILDKRKIHYTGIRRPTLVLCLSQEGVHRRKSIFSKLDTSCLVITGSEIALPATAARVVAVDFSQRKVVQGQRGLAALAVASAQGCGLRQKLVEAGIVRRYRGEQRAAALTTYQDFSR